MKSSLRRGIVPAVALLASAPLAQAHPGHDGHDLTWDLGHLAAYPGATILCFGVLGMVAWGLWKAFAAESAEPQRVRVRRGDLRE